MCARLLTCCWKEVKNHVGLKSLKSSIMDIDVSLNIVARVVMVVVVVVVVVSSTIII